MRSKLGNKEHEVLPKIAANIGGRILTTLARTKAEQTWSCHSQNFQAVKAEHLGRGG